MALGKLNGTGDEGVLWGAVDEGASLQYAGNCKDSRGRDFGVALVDSFDEVVSRVVDTLDDVGVALRIGGPQNNDLVKAIYFFEFAASS
jgi:hypothetical protein